MAGPGSYRPVRRSAHADMLNEGFSPTHLDMKAPRTALGVTDDNRGLLVTVDGRQSTRSNGATLQGLAQLMLELGAVEAHLARWRRFDSPLG